MNISPNRSLYFAANKENETSKQNNKGFSRTTNFAVSMGALACIDIGEKAISYKKGSKMLKDGTIDKAIAELKKKFGDLDAKAKRTISEKFSRMSAKSSLKELEFIKENGGKFNLKAAKKMVGLVSVLALASAATMVIAEKVLHKNQDKK